MSNTDEPSTALIRLEVELGVDPIRGRIGRATGDWTPFAGWLDLLGALERVREQGAPEKSSVGSTVRTGRSGPKITASQ